MESEVCKVQVKSCPESKYQKWLERVWSSLPAEPGTTQSFIEWVNEWDNQMRLMYYQNLKMINV